jgi:hypothetical protein
VSRSSPKWPRVVASFSFDKTWKRNIDYIVFWNLWFCDYEVLSCDLPLDHGILPSITLWVLYAIWLSISLLICLSIRFLGVILYVWLSVCSSGGCLSVFQSVNKDVNQYIFKSVNKCACLSFWYS